MDGPAILTLLSLCILPLSFYTGVAIFCWLAVRTWIAVDGWKIDVIKHRGQRVLLTGEDDQAVLAIARVLHAAGAAVYVVKHERIPFLNLLRTSKAVYKFVGLSSGRLTPILRHFQERLFRYAALAGVKLNIGIQINFPGTVLRLVDSERITTWISCDAARPSLAAQQAKDIVVKHSGCQIFGPDTATVKLAHSYHAFAQHVSNANTDVRCPKTRVVHTRAEIHEAIGKASKKQRFLLERASPPQRALIKANSGEKRDSVYSNSTTLYDSDDTLDFDGADTSTPDQEYVVLPQSSSNETYNVVSRIRISQDSPWIMHELVQGKPGTISALVINGKVKAFAARNSLSIRTFSTAATRPSSPKPRKLKVDHDIKEWQRHEQTTFIDPTSSIGVALQDYAKQFVAALPNRPSVYMSLHFFLTDYQTADGAEQKIIATGCDFNFSPLLAEQALISDQAPLLGRVMTGQDNKDDAAVLLFGAPATILSSSGDRYTFPALFLEKRILSGLQLLRRKISLDERVRSLAEYYGMLAYGKEQIYDADDRKPWIWHWLVQNPVETAYEAVVTGLERLQRAVARI